MSNRNSSNRDYSPTIDVDTTLVSDDDYDPDNPFIDGNPDRPYLDGNTDRSFLDGNATRPSLYTDCSFLDGNATRPSSDENASRHNSDRNATHHNSDGSANRHNSDGSANRHNSDGSATSTFSDGNATRPYSDGSATRPYSDGNATRPYSDGSAERRYPESPYSDENPVMTLDTDKLSRSVAGLLRDLRRPRDGFEDGENKQNVYLSRRFLKRPEEHKKLFVCNIAFTIDKDELETIFASYGPIKDLNLFQRTDHNGKPKTRYAFVTYETHEDAQAALELDGKLVDYRALNVRIARPNKKNHSINR